MIAHNPLRTPYKRLYDTICGAVAEIPDFHGDIFLVMAICVRESMGVPWFCRCDSLYKAHVGTIRRYHGESTLKQFLSLLTVKGGVNAGKIPKFRYNHSWYEEVARRETTAGLYPEQRVFLSCGYGLALKAAINHHSDELLPEWLLAVDSLIRSERYQIQTLIKDLSDFGAFRTPEPIHALTRFTTMESPKRVPGYAPQIVDLASELERMYGG
mgnify:CR=1 FL=1